MLGGGIGSVSVELGESVVEVAVRKQQCVAAVDIGVRQESRVVSPAGECSLEGDTVLRPGVGGCKKACLWRATERALAYERVTGADGNSGQVRILGEGAVVGGVCRKRLLYQGCEVGVAPTQEDALCRLVLELALEALGPVSQRVELCSVEFSGACIDAEDLQQCAGVDEVDLVIKLIVKVARFENELFAEDVLINAYIVGSGAKGLNRFDVVGLDGGGVAGFDELLVERGELDGEGWLLHAGGGVGAELGAMEALRAGANWYQARPMRGVPAVP